MNSKVFVNNRKKVLNLMKDNSCLVIYSKAKEDVKHEVNRNYYYLSGNFENGNIIILTKINGVCNEIMFIHPYDELKAKWVGAPLSKEEVGSVNGINDIRYLDEYDNVLDSILKEVPTLYLDLANEDKLLFEVDLSKDLKEKYQHLVILNAVSLFKTARTVKCSEEVDEMRKAIEITRLGIENMLVNMNELYEYQLESYFDQAIKYNGATGYAFPTIAASGKNACCLHYVDNDCKALNGDLILFDLGASYNMYCADISRTFPVSGKFTERQKVLYNIVLEAQKVAMENTKPGITTKELNQIVINFWTAILYARK